MRQWGTDGCQEAGMRSQAGGMRRDESPACCRGDNRQEADGSLWGGLEWTYVEVVWVSGVTPCNWAHLTVNTIFPNVANGTASILEPSSAFFPNSSSLVLRKCLFCIEEAPLLSLETQEPKTAEKQKEKRVKQLYVK